MNTLIPTAPGRPMIYLAGPTVFEPDPDAMFLGMKEVCARYGIEGLSPLDGQIGLEGELPGRALAARIVIADLQLMQRADGAVFCLDGFRRGPEMDAGTAFEIGYMHALGKPLAGWTSDRRTYPERVAAFFRDAYSLRLTSAAASGVGGRSGSLRDPDGVLVHSEGLYQNAMTEISIEQSGGAVYADASWSLAFERAVANLAERVHRTQR